MDLRVLGVLIVDDGRVAPTPRDRLVMAALAARMGMTVTVESLAAALWGEGLPTSWSRVIPGCIMRLRRLIAPARIETTPQGYRLSPDGIELDAEKFERLVARGSQLLELGEPDRAAHALAEALALWRGQPFADLPDWEPAQIASYRLEEIRLAAEESLLEARLQAGDLLDVVAQARARVAEAPMRERRWVILGLAQYRQGRQADALATVRRGRELLAAELGLDPCAELAALEQAILHQDPTLQSGVAFRAASAECPYFGLPAAGMDDAERYFGREEEIERGLLALERRGVLIVSGSSGVGKSSFVRAGIGARFVARGRRVIVVTPGERPAQTLREVEHNSESLLIVDQCEQAIANDDPAETEQFFDELGRMVFRGPIVMAIRADRLGDLADHFGFAGLIQSNLLMLGPLSTEGLRAVIEKPARQAGLILEPGLGEILIRDADGRNLPLLSHALHQVWERREGRVLSVDGYRASGEIEGAVAQTAEEVFAELSDEGSRQARDILLRLVEPSRGGGVVCQRVDRASVAIDEAHARVAERLVDARLVTSDEESFQLAHEAVAREWPRLREWLADDVEGQRIMRHVTAAASAWEAMGRPDSELYRGARLSATAQWRESARPVLAVVEAAFLDAAIDREAADLAATRRQLQQERRSVRRLRWLAGAAASLAVVAVAAGTLAAVQADAANQQAVVEDARRVAALASAEPAYERALLLAVEAISLWDAPATRMALLDVMGRSPRIVSVTRTIGDIGVQQMSLAPGGATAVVVDDHEDARVIDLDRHAQIGEFVYDGGGSQGSVVDIVLDAVAAPDGQIALSVLEDPCQPDGSCETTRFSALDLDDPGGGDTTFTGFDHYAIDVEFSPDRSLAAVIAALPWEDEPGNIGIWRVGTPDAPMLLDLPDAGTNPGAPNWMNAFGRVRFSPDGSRLYASGFGPTAIFDTRTGELVGDLPGQGVLAVSPDGESVLVREGRTAVRIVDLDDPTESRLLEMPDVVIDAAFSPDGNNIVTTGRSGASLWSSAGSAVLKESLDGHVGPVTAAAFLPTGELVTAGADGALITWVLDDWSESFRDQIRRGKEIFMPRDDRTLVYERPDGSFVGISADPDIWLDRACAVAGRGLTEQEWQAVFADDCTTPRARRARSRRRNRLGRMQPVHFGQYPPARRTILHLSDTHLLAGNPPLGGRYDTAANLARTLEAVERLDLRPDAIVFTGDLTDLGEPEAYAALRAAVEPVAARLSAPVVWVAGNHDERPALRHDLLGLEPTLEPVTGVWDLGGLRLIALDTSVPGWHHGDLDPEQLEWLRGILATPAPLGTLLALHHPPLPSHVPLFDILELRDQDRLAEAIAGSDVRGILAGHLHYSTSGTFAGVPVSVAAATCYTMNLARPAASVNGMDAGQSFHLVHVYDHTITHSVVPAVDAPTGEYFSPEWVARMAQLTPQERLEAFSRKPSA